MRERGLLLKILTVAGAWLPFLVFWVFFFTFYGGETLAQALPWGTLTIGSAALLGVGVWRFCALHPWPARMRLSFYVRHFEAAAVYAIGWIFAVYGADAIVSRHSLFRMLQSSPIVVWHFLMGVWLYGVVAGVCYGIQTQRRAGQSERRAIRAQGAL